MSPPDDHAWRMELHRSAGNDTLRFVHNTDHVDIKWLTPADILRYVGVWTGTLATDTGQTTDVKVSTSVDVEEGTVQGSVQTDDLMGMLTGVESHFSGTMALDGDSLQVDFQQDSLTVDGSVFGAAARPFFKGLQIGPGLAGSVNLFDGGQLSGDMSIEVFGTPMNVGMEGTLGQTQTIVDFETDHLDFKGTILATEDSVVVPGSRRCRASANAVTGPCDTLRKLPESVPIGHAIYIHAHGAGSGRDRGLRCAGSQGQDPREWNCNCRAPFGGGEWKGASERAIRLRARGYRCAGEGGAGTRGVYALEVVRGPKSLECCG